MTGRTDPDAHAHDAAYGSAGWVFGYPGEPPEHRYARRSRNLSVFVAVAAVIVLLALLILGFTGIALLHSFTNTHTGN
jgi:hypothetical protein